MDSTEHPGGFSAIGRVQLMEVYVIAGAEVRDCAPGDLPAILAAGEGVVWVDVPVWDDEAAAVLAAVFTLHPLALRDCTTWSWTSSSAPGTSSRCTGRSTRPCP